ERGRRGGARALHDDRHRDPDPGENPSRARTRPRERLEVPRNAFHPRLEEVDPGEEQSEARQDRAERAHSSVRDQPQQGADPEQRQSRIGNPDAQAEVRHHPRRRGGSQSRADRDPDRLREGDETGADEADHGEDRRGRGLARHREERAGDDRAEPAGDEPLERAPQRIAREALQTLAEVMDAQPEHAQPAEKGYDGSGIHALARRDVHVPASAAVTAPRREALERMINFSSSTTRKNTNPPRNSHGQTYSGTASLSNRRCSGGA